MCHMCECAKCVNVPHVLPYGEGWASSAQHPSCRWADLVAWTCEYVAEISAMGIGELGSKRRSGARRGGPLATGRYMQEAMKARVRAGFVRTARRTAVGSTSVHGWIPQICTVCACVCAFGMCAYTHWCMHECARACTHTHCQMAVDLVLTKYSLPYIFDFHN